MSELCEQRSDQFVSLYLFQNGVPCQPEKLRVRRSEVDKFFNKTDKFYYYHSKALYTLTGKCVSSFERVRDSMAFVLMFPHENFIKSNYMEAFDAIVAKRKEQKTKFDLKEQKRSKSAPSIPSSADYSMRHQSGNDVEKERLMKCDKTKLAQKKEKLERQRSKDHVHCVTKDKYPCCNEDSDVSDEAAKRDFQKTKSKQSTIASNYKATPMKGPHKKPDCPEKPKKGLFAKCCPCCIKRPKSRPAYGDFDASRPESRACNGKKKKMTQTYPEDFKRAKKCLKAAIKEEKRRQKIYGKNKQTKDDMKCAEERENLKYNEEINDCENPKDKIKKEAEYRKARDKYRQKRKKMEEKINKVMEKEMKKQKSC